jgi:aconitate hydratase
VRAVIAESFERIHRSNLIGMGVLPLVFAQGTSWQSLKLNGSETVSLCGLNDIAPGQQLEAEITYPDGDKGTVPLRAAVDTFDELDYFCNGGILHFVVRSLVKAAV